jgi:transposase-like protein
MERRKFTREFKLEAVRLIKDRGVSFAQASQDLGVHVSQLRSWVKKFADDPQHAFPGHGQMKPEQLEIARLKREVIKLKAERDILKKAAVDSTDERNMMDIMFTPGDSQWHKSGGLACHHSRSRSCGHGGKQESR